MTTIYRSAQLDDWPAFDQLEQAVWKSLGIITTPKPTFENWVEIGGDLFVVAEDEGKLVGYINACLIDFSPDQFSTTKLEKILRAGFLGDIHEQNGMMVYGNTVAVHPNYRRSHVADGVGSRQLEVGRAMGKRWYMTLCRIPGFARYLKMLGQVIPEGLPDEQTLNLARAYTQKAVALLGGNPGLPLAAYRHPGELPATSFEEPSLAFCHKYGIEAHEACVNYGYADPQSANCQVVVISSL